MYFFGSHYDGFRLKFTLPWSFYPTLSTPKIQNLIQIQDQIQYQIQFLIQFLQPNNT